MRKSIILLFAVLLLAAGCAIHRASVASRAQKEMIGMSKRNLLACAGTPARAAVAGGTEFLTYVSGGDTVGSVNTYSTGHGSYTYHGGGYGSGTYQSYGGGVVSTERRYCEVTFVLEDGVVSKINYSGRTGGLLTKGEQCAFAVENCLDQDK